MIILIGGAGHSGKTLLAQQLLERYRFPYTSLDHVKMGLCRGGLAAFTPTDPDEQISAQLWPVVEGMIRTCLENGQNRIFEGCYLPPARVKPLLGEEVAALYLVLSEPYLRAHYDLVVSRRNAIEQRRDAQPPSLAELLAENARVRAECFAAGLPIVEIREDYERELAAALHALQPRLIRLRPYTPDDLPALLQLFYDTVHSVCLGHYSAAQLDAWAPAEPDRVEWGDSLLRHHTLVAEIGGQIVGFGDLTGDYFDRLYVHRDFQRLGVGTALAAALERSALESGIPALSVHASKPARAFFERRGYRLVRPQTVTRRGEQLLNYAMCKSFSPPEPAEPW